jgi:SAM-dependent methyltransferase
MIVREDCPDVIETPTSELVVTVVRTPNPLSDPDGIDLLLRRGLLPHPVTLEDYVAYQWESGGNVLGQRHGKKRDAVILKWLGAAIRAAGDSSTVLDVGCSYGNHLFMLDGALGKPHGVEMVGVDLFEPAIRRANVFAQTIPGFSNCRFEVADVSVGLPFEDDAFDAINLADVVEHLVDPRSALRELRRVAKPGATIVISTPLKDSVFKRIAVIVNRMFRGHLYEAYYRGKDTDLDEEGRPIMETPAGHDHVSEMTLVQLTRLCGDVGLAVEEIEPMSVMSGSRWFDRHGVLLAVILIVETIHEKLRRPGWAHSVMLRLRKI